MPINGLTGFGGGNGGILSGGVPDPTYAISASTTSVNEGSSVTFTVTTTNVNNGTTLYYSINPVSGSINSSDFSSGTTGSFTVNSNSGSISIGIANDTTTESGSDVFNLRIHTGSTGGPIVVTSVNVTINDTSQDPTQAVYHQSGTYSFVAPVIAAGTNVHVVCVGGGLLSDTLETHRQHLYGRREKNAGTRNRRSCHQFF